MQCVELEAALRHQQEAYTELEGQLSGSRQKGKELQVRFCCAWSPWLSLLQIPVRTDFGIKWWQHPQAQEVPSQAFALHLQRS